jgi:hypothetical protein
MRIYAFALAVSMAVPALGQTDDYASRLYQSKRAQIFSGHETPSPQVAFTPKPPPKQPVAKGDSLVSGAIVCPSLDEATWLYKMIGSAKVARENMPPQARELTVLKDGYDPYAAPNPTDYRCQFVPAGTPMNVKWVGGLPVVSGKTNDGLPFAGVTIPTMVDY